jgi:hypothetical protein
MADFWLYLLVALPFTIPVLGIFACISTRSGG